MLCSSFYLAVNLFFISPKKCSQFGLRMVIKYAPVIPPLDTGRIYAVFLLVFVHVSVLTRDVACHVCTCNVFTTIEDPSITANTSPPPGLFRIKIPCIWLRITTKSPRWIRGLNLVISSYKISAITKECSRVFS